MASNQLDSIVTKIVERFTTRAQVGQNKYGTNLDRKDLSTTEWLTHLIKELHDAILYAEKARQESIKQHRLIELLRIEHFQMSHVEMQELDSLLSWYEESKKISQQLLQNPINGRIFEYLIKNTHYYVNNKNMYRLWS